MARLIPRDIHADVNAGFTLVELLHEIDEREAKHLVEWARCNQTEVYKMPARLMPREIHADVSAGTSLVECLREIEERRAKHKE